MDVTEPHGRRLTKSYKRIRYRSPMGFDGVPPEKYQAVASIPWITRRDVEDEALKDFARLSLYALDVWRYLIDVND